MRQVSFIIRCGKSLNTDWVGDALADRQNLEIDLNGIKFSARCYSIEKDERPDGQHTKVYIDAKRKEDPVENYREAAIAFNRATEALAKASDALVRDGLSRSRESDD